MSDLGQSPSADLSQFSLAEPLENVLQERRVREGLPTTYRMRADSHYVDQLLAPRDVPVIRLIRTRQIEAADLAPADGSPAFARSIAEHGILQPLLVRPSGARYQLIAGRKRLGAALMAGLTEVPCVVHEVDAATAARLSAADNLRANADADATASARESDSLNHVLGMLSDEVGDMIPLIDLLKRGNASQHRTFADVLLVQAWRAAWLADAVALATQPYRSSERRLLGAIVDRVQRGFEHEARLNGRQISFAVAAGAASRAVDDHFATALAALTFVAMSWQTRNDPLSVEVRVDAVDASTIKVEIVHRTAMADPATLCLIQAVPATTPAGDPRIAIAIEAAQAYVHHYGGRLTVTPIGTRGSLIHISVITALTD